jgi:NADP-dependent aldehyde dehydrogenase
VTLLVVARDSEQMARIAEALGGNLTASVYSHTQGQDDAACEQLSALLRYKVGRLLNDKMPTGVAVSPAMSHGGPFPATGHPGFTSVGIPASFRRFLALHCYDNVRPGRLPPELCDPNPNGLMWRSVDGVLTRADVKPKR